MYFGARLVDVLRTLPLFSSGAMAQACQTVTEANRAAATPTPYWAWQRAKALPSCLRRPALPSPPPPRARLRSPTWVSLFFRRAARFVKKKRGEKNSQQQALEVMRPQSRLKQIHLLADCRRQDVEASRWDTSLLWTAQDWSLTVPVESNVGVPDMIV